MRSGRWDRWHGGKRRMDEMIFYCGEDNKKENEECYVVKKKCEVWGGEKWKRANQEKRIP